MTGQKLSARQQAALTRYNRMNDIVHAAAAPPTPEDMQRLTEELQRARDATAELAEAHQRLQIAFRQVRDLKLCPNCSQPHRKQVSA